MKKIDSGERCETRGCHRRATYETSDGFELCGTHAREHPEWVDTWADVTQQIAGPGDAD